MALHGNNLAAQAKLERVNPVSYVLGPDKDLSLKETMYKTSTLAGPDHSDRRHDSFCSFSRGSRVDYLSVCFILQDYSRYSRRHFTQQDGHKTHGGKPRSWASMPSSQRPIMTSPGLRYITMGGISPRMDTRSFCKKGEGHPVALLHRHLCENVAVHSVILCTPHPTDYYLFRPGKFRPMADPLVLEQRYTQICGSCWGSVGAAMSC